MAGISGLQSVLTDLFSQYTDGLMPYDEYAANVQMIQQGDPEMFQQVQDVNTAQKGKMLDTLQFDTNGYSMDDWSKAGLENIKSGNLDVPFGTENDFLPLGGSETDVWGAHSGGRVFVSGNAIEQPQMPLSEVLRHEGAHSVFNFPGISQEQEEGLVRQRDNQYATINNTARPNVPPMTELQASQLQFVNDNINNRTQNPSTAVRDVQPKSAWEQFAGLFN